MDWFGRILSRGRGQPRPAAPPPMFAADPRRTNEATTPPLFLLVRDASGLASLQLHSFEDTHAAREYIEFWFPERREGSVIAFWAFTREPETTVGLRAEPTVLVRDVTRPGVVYPFSFLSLDEAYAFVQREMDRGIEGEAMLVYWAVSIRIAVDADGRVTLSPATPPPAKRPKELAPRPGSQFRARTDPVPSFGPPVRPTPQSDARIDALARQVDRIVERAEATAEASDPKRVEEDNDPEALSEDLLRYLQQKRWEQKDGPFEGFNSPPGRF